MIFKFTDGTEYTVLNDTDFKHMIGYYLENDLVFLQKEAITTDNACINSLDVSNITKDHIKRLFNNCVDKAITAISIYDLKQYCINNKLQYQSMYVLFKRIFGTNFIEKLNDLYKKYTNL